MNLSGNIFANMLPVVCDQHYSALAEMPENSTNSCTSVRALCNIKTDCAKNRRLQWGYRLRTDKNPLFQLLMQF